MKAATALAAAEVVAAAAVAAAVAAAAAAVAELVAAVAAAMAARCTELIHVGRCKLILLATLESVAW